MNKMNFTLWGSFQICKLFDIHPTRAYKLTNSKLFENGGQNPVIVNSSYNNGVGGYTNLPNTENGQIITFSDTTSADAIFYQDKSFVGYPHVQGLYAIGEYKECWSKYSLLFFLSVFKRRAKCLNFDYVNKFTRDMAKTISVRLPVDKLGNPDFSYMESYMKNLEIKVDDALTKLQSVNRSTSLTQATNVRWKEFVIEDVFPRIIKPEVYHTREVEQYDAGIPYVVRSKFNNGIKYRVARPKGKVNPPNVISFGAENATFFYQKEEWISGRDMYYIDTRDLDEYACLYITACLQPTATKYSYNFGLFPDLLKKEKVKLPVDESGKPNYVYMAKYMERVKAKVSNNILLFKIAQSVEV